MLIEPLVHADSSGRCNRLPKFPDFYQRGKKNPLKIVFAESRSFRLSFISYQSFLPHVLKVTFRPHVKEASPDQQVPGGWRAQLFLLLGFFAQLCDFAWVLSWTLLHSALVFLWLLDNFETSPVTCPLFCTCLVTAERKRSSVSVGRNVLLFTPWSLPWRYSVFHCCSWSFLPSGRFSK